ncbi:hypothetical protein CMI38_03605 [Candidatus Pacearchaeota archaeon]|jgi:predicted nucleic acid-binding protein|nr:hypothetical protein [Candidatus Pacearchaeota archaeon]|tara:strand:- start:319 stop:738 length:420 start_codon:yes stop_codon:yes gene_type:complete
MINRNGSNKFIDANIFLEILLDDENADRCSIFFKGLINGDFKAITSDFIIYTCVLKIERKLNSKKVMRKFISSIKSMKGLTIVRPSIKVMYNSTKIGEKYNLDFDDSLIVSVMMEYGVDEIVSFDKHFDKVEMIKRVEP